MSDEHEGNDEHEEREPLADLREDVERSREAETDDEFEALFTDVDVGSVDEADVWEQLSASADEPVAESAGVEAGATEELDRDVRVVEKRLCQGCEHFSDPPETACTHEGTTIEAEVDTDHFRVVNCPVVAAREASEASDFSADEP